jgi:hypothetical protein
MYGILQLNFEALLLNRLSWNFGYTFGSRDNAFWYKKNYNFFKMAAVTKWRLNFFFIYPVDMGIKWKGSTSRIRWNKWRHKKFKMAPVPRWRNTFFFITPLIWISNERAWRVENDKISDVIKIQNGACSKMAECVFLYNPLDMGIKWKGSTSRIGWYKWRHKKFKMAPVPRWRNSFFFMTPLIWLSNERARREEYDKTSNVIKNSKWRALQDGGIGFSL